MAGPSAKKDVKEALPPTESDSKNKSKTHKNPKKRSSRTILRRILEEAKALDFTQTDRVQAFESKYKTSLLNRTSQDEKSLEEPSLDKDENVLHALAKSEDWSAEQIKSFLKWLLDKYYGLLGKRIT